MLISETAEHGDKYVCLGPLHNCLTELKEITVENRLISEVMASLDFRPNMLPQPET